MQNEEQKEEKQAIDMTSDEAMEYLFSPEVVDELKNVAHPERRQVVENNGDDCD